VQGIGGLIIVALFYFVMWLLSNATKQSREKDAALQQKILAAKQQGAAGAAEPRKKYRQIEELRNKTGDAFVPAVTVSPPSLARESMFGEQGDRASVVYAESTPGSAIDTASTAQQMSESANPIAREIMAMMTTPQSMQKVVILNEIFNRPKSVME